MKPRLTRRRLIEHTREREGFHRRPLPNNNKNCLLSTHSLTLSLSLSPSSVAGRAASEGRLQRERDCVGTLGTRIRPMVAENRGRNVRGPRLDSLRAESRRDDDYAGRARPLISPVLPPKSRSRNVIIVHIAAGARPTT